ncbi:hypothetical protein APHAL10511_003339 [Amanita phalloides]|nr:hypothetical protein APHAL10511_003339 [Amanita phalloides]
MSKGIKEPLSQDHSYNPPSTTLVSQFNKSVIMPAKKPSASAASTTKTASKSTPKAPAAPTAPGATSTPKAPAVAQPKPSSKAGKEKK